MNNKAALTAYCLILCLFTAAQVPVANFKSDITGGCAPIIVNFQDLSTGNPTAWAWDFGNGSGSSRQNPSTTYFEEGTYVVTLTASNASGSHTVTRVAYITVYREPTAEFTVNGRTGCTPAKIRFRDVSTTPPGTTVTGWRWDFGDGGTSTEQNPEYTYRTPGSFTVTLTITNDKGCTKLVTKPNYIDIIQGVVPSFTNSIPSECAAPSVIQFTNQSTGPGTLSYYWNFGDGNTASSVNASNRFMTNGTYSVALAVTSSIGCTDTIRRDIEIGRVNSSFTVPDNICPKSPVQFVNTSNPRPIKTFWRFSDGQTDTLRNPIVSFATGGTYTVTLINTFEICTDSSTKTFTVLPPPAIAFDALDTGKCAAPFLVTFQNKTPNGVSYIWDFGDSTATSNEVNPTHNYTKTNNFDVTLIATGANGCRDTLVQKSFIEIKKPVISFPGMPRGGCLPYTSTFEALILSPDPVTSYQWNFGDGGTSTEAKPSYTYNKTGNYDVTLTITTKGGCTETYRLANAIKVGTKADPLFIAQKFDGCAYRDIQFINQTVDNATPPLEYLWQFSDGSTSTQKDPLHTFTGTGVMDVTLTAINNGCENTITKQNYVTVRPSVAFFDYQPNCNNRNEYTFVDKSIGAVTWAWDFGDGTTSNQRNPGPHLFPGEGTYTIKLTTTSLGGACPYVLERTITIKEQKPDFQIPVLNGCKGRMGQTIFASVPDPKLINRYVWDFGDGSVVDAGNSAAVFYSYTKAGLFNVTLTVIDSFGCKTAVTKANHVRVLGPQPVFTGQDNTGCKGLTATFTDASVTDGTTKIVGWTWDFGDGTRQSYNRLIPFRHQYDTIGDFNVKLIVTDDAGCSDSTTLREFVKVSTIKAQWEVPAQSCPGAANTFTNRTKSDARFSTFWELPDNRQYTGNRITHAFSDTGFFAVKMKVVDELGCADSLTKDSAVYVGLPKADFDANNFTTYCTPFEAKFINQSTFSSGAYWTFGPGKGFGTQTDPKVYYTETGAYPITLVAISPGGCRDTITKTLNVYNPEDGTIKYGPIEGCRPTKVQMEAFTQMKGQFIWDFGDGTVTDTTDHIVTHSYENLGSFTPRIILIQPEGCKVPLAGKDVIEIIGAKAMFNINQKLFCDSGYLAIRDSSVMRDPVLSYTWNFGDGTTSNNPAIAGHYYSKPGNYDVSLVIATTTGCNDTARIGPIRVVESPLIGIRGDTAICVDDHVNYQGLFQRTDTSVVRWNWRLPDGSSFNKQSPGLLKYSTPGRFDVRAIATNSSGCADTASQTLWVHALPTATLPPTVPKQVGFPLTLPATYSSGVVSYNWTPASTLSCTDCPNPVATPKFNTRYDVNIVDSNGCKNSAHVQVLVFCENANVFIPNTFSPNGDGSNDVFYVRGKGLDRVKSLRIFNRWGQVVFEKRDFAVNDPSVGWDGRFKGASPQPDVYIYQVEVFCENSQIIRYEGNIALIL